MSPTCWLVFAFSLTIFPALHAEKVDRFELPWLIQDAV
jgi:hypothetical protein